VTRVDAHHHFLAPSRRRYPWLDPSWTALRADAGPDRLRPHLRAAEIDATVLVQTLPDEDETEELLAHAAQHRWIAGVVGWVDLTAPDVPGRLERLRARPGGERLVGIRHNVHDEADPRWLGRADVRRGLAACADAGLAFDLLLKPRDLPAAVEAVAALPALTFVVDHLAKPPIADGWSAPWADGIRALAGHDHVSAKLSGLVTEAHWTGWTAAELRPAVEHARACFGDERLLFGSDWPVCELAAGYDEVLGAALEALGTTAAQADASGLLGANAARVYGLS
jgi:L-fuconolactonase